LPPPSAAGVVVGTREGTGDGSRRKLESASARLMVTSGFLAEVVAGTGGATGRVDASLTMRSWVAADGGRASAGSGRFRVSSVARGDVSVPLLGFAAAMFSS
jgi:hypothetical protein